MEEIRFIKKEFTALGCFFVAIAAFLYATKHITAAIMTSQVNSAEVNYFQGGYDSIGFGSTFWMVLSLVVGLLFLIIGIGPAFQKWRGRSSSIEN